MASACVNCSTYKTFIMVIITLCALISGCAAKQTHRSSCGVELDSAWQELDIAKAKGFSGSISYSKAFGLITLAKSMQTVENFDGCMKHAQDARYYIRQAGKGY